MSRVEAPVTTPAGLVRPVVLELLERVRDASTRGEIYDAADCFAEDVCLYKDEQAFCGKAQVLADQAAIPPHDVEWTHVFVDGDTAFVCGTAWFEGQDRFHFAYRATAKDGLLHEARMYLPTLAHDQIAEARDRV